MNLLRNKSLYFILLISSLTLAVADKKTINDELLNVISKINTETSSEISNIQININTSGKPEIQEVQLLNGQILSGKDLQSILERSPILQRGTNPGP